MFNVRVHLTVTTSICQFVEEVALLQVELGLQCGKDDVERILGVIGG